MGAENYSSWSHGRRAMSPVCMVCLLDKDKPYRDMPHQHTRWELLRYYVTTSKPVVIVHNWFWQRKNGRL